MDPESGDAGSRRAPRGRARLLRIAIGLVILAVGGWLVSRDVDDLRAALTDVGPGALIVSAGLAVLGTVLIGQVWTALLRGLGVQAPGRTIFKVFFISQLGKYLPGSVWPVVAQMEFGHRWGTARRTMFAANVLLLACIAATGLTVGVALLPWSSRDGLSRYGWTLLLLPPLLACLHPRTIPAALDLALRAVGRDPLGVRATTRSMVQAVGWSLLVWVVLGLHLLVLTRTLGAGLLPGAAAAVGGMGLAWAAGLIFIPAPAGAGVRDAVLVATFAPQISGPDALAVALTSRVLLLLADVVLAGVAALVRADVREPPGARSGRGRAT